MLYDTRPEHTSWRHEAPKWKEMKARIGPTGKLLCFWNFKIMEQRQHQNLFDNCTSHHLVLLKSSMTSKAHQKNEVRNWKATMSSKFRMLGSSSVWQDGVIKNSQNLQISPKNFPEKLHLSKYSYISCTSFYLVIICFCIVM